MRKKRSKVLQILAAAEDIMILFDDYFSKDFRKGVNLDDWLSIGARGTTYYFIKEGVLNPDLTFKQKPKSILRLIKKPWDGKWRFVVFDIPQKEVNFRNIIRRRLKELGFKLLQRSVWFSPLPLGKVVKKLDKKIDDYNYLTVIEGKIYRDDPKRIIKNKWNTLIWQEKANMLIKELKSREKISDEDKNKFWELILEHPRVPLELLSKNWPLKNLVKFFFL